jgi:hypothetical protein
MPILLLKFSKDSQTIKHKQTNSNTIININKVGSVESLKWNPAKENEICVCFSTNKQPALIDVTKPSQHKSLENLFNTG